MFNMLVSKVPWLNCRKSSCIYSPRELLELEPATLDLVYWPYFFSVFWCYCCSLARRLLAVDRLCCHQRQLPWLNSIRLCSTATISISSRSLTKRPSCLILSRQAYVLRDFFLLVSVEISINFSVLGNSRKLAWYLFLFSSANWIHAWTRTRLSHWRNICLLAAGRFQGT